jgi:murein DD-endopeptidase MepM/ murein hydrolase activator NlpD
MGKALRIFALIFLALWSSVNARAASISYLAPNVIYTQSQIQSFFENSGNPYLVANAAKFAAMSYHVESYDFVRQTKGNSAIFNGSCCTGLMQMNTANLRDFCKCTRAEYAAMTGQQQINVYALYYASISNTNAVTTLQQMQANGQTLGGYPVTGATIVACIQLGVGNCQRSINNGCNGTSPSQGGDGYVNICTMAAKADAGGTPGGGTPGGGTPGGGTPGGGTGGGTGGGPAGGGGTCFASMPMQGSQSIFSEYGAWARFAGNGYHRGVDMWKGTGGASAASQIGTPQIAVDSGKVTWGGSSLNLTRGDRSQARYMHLSKRFEQNQNVTPGQKIGEMGYTGTSGPSQTHLHFEFLVPGSQIKGGTGSRVFADGSSKRNKSAALSAAQIAAALPNTLYYVNPETYFPNQIPLVGNARARTGRSTSLPNTCSPDTASLEEPRSSSENISGNEAIRGEAEFRGAEVGTAQEQTNNDQKSLWIDFARMIALDAKSETVDNSPALDSAMGHLVLSVIDKPAQ